MALSPELILRGAQQAVSPIGSLIGGIQTGQQLAGERQRQNLLTQQAGLQQQLQQQQLESGALELEQAKGQMSLEQAQGAFKGMFSLATQASALPLGQQAKFMRDNAGQFDIPGVEDFSDVVQGSSDAEILETIPKIMKAGQQQGFGRIAETASQKDFKTYQRLKESDPEKAIEFGRQAGFIRETEEEKADIKVDEAARKEIAKFNVKRKQGFVDAGVDAADSTANIRRSIELLEGIKTGGFDAALLKAEQIFGVEGADEGELSGNLGKAVLAQLKPIFGAAFTAQEGERLERIEASFGRSTATNKRLLNNALTIAERAARRGMAAAEELDDNFTASEIRNALKFKLTPAGEQAELATKETSIDDLVSKYAD